MKIELDILDILDSLVYGEEEEEYVSGPVFESEAEKKKNKKSQDFMNLTDLNIGVDFLLKVQDSRESETYSKISDDRYKIEKLVNIKIKTILDTYSDNIATTDDLYDLVFFMHNHRYLVKDTIEMRFLSLVILYKNLFKSNIYTKQTKNMKLNLSKDGKLIYARVYNIKTKEGLILTEKDIKTILKKERKISLKEENLSIKHIIKENNYVVETEITKRNFIKEMTLMGLIGKKNVWW